MSQYRYATHARARATQVEQYTLHHHVRGRDVRPCWLSQQNFVIVRVLPAVGPGGEPVPYRYSAEGTDFTDWLRSYPCARSFGLQQRRTIIILDPSDPAAESDEIHPYVALERTISQGLKHGTLPTEVVRRLGMFSRFPPLRPPVSMGYALCLVYAANGEWYCSKDHPPRGWNPEDPLQVLELPTSALRSLEQALQAVKDPEAAAEGKWDRGFVCGDITNVSGGAFLCFYDPKTQSLPPQLKDVVWHSEQEVKSRDVARYYAMAVAKRLVVGGTEITPRVPHWDKLAPSLPSLGEVVRVLSHAEAAEAIAQVFAECPEFITFGWKSYPQFLTERVQRILRHSVDPGVTPPVEPRRESLPSESPRRRQSVVPSSRDGVGRSPSARSAFLEQARRQDFFDPDPEFDEPEDEAVDDEEEEDGGSETRELEQEIEQLLQRGAPSADKTESESGDEDLPPPVTSKRGSKRRAHSGDLPWQS